VSSGPAQPPPPPGEATATPEPTVGLPNTGGSVGRPDLVNMPLVVYVDLNHNGRYDAGEGVRGLDLIFRAGDGTTETLASTDRSGRRAADAHGEQGSGGAPPEEAAPRTPLAALIWPLIILLIALLLVLPALTTAFARYNGQTNGGAGTIGQEQTPASPSVTAP